MINIRTFQLNMLQENSYVVYDDTREAVIIDCGAFYNEERKAVVKFIRNEGLKLCHVLCTHGHLDHCFGNDTLFDEFGLKPEANEGDEFLMRDLAQQAADFFGMDYDHPTPPIGHIIAHNEIISFGQHQLKAIPTPGHTPGGLTFYCEEEHVAFTGDTLFRMSIGRTDFKGSSWQDMMQSLRNLVRLLPDNTDIYPGHGPKTTMKDEKNTNPYVRNY